MLTFHSNDKFDGHKGAILNLEIPIPCITLYTIESIKARTYIVQIDKCQINQEKVKEYSDKKIIFIVKRARDEKFKNFRKIYLRKIK